jgi:hypothetical protein
MKALGKIGKINVKARKEIARIAEEKGITRCEIQYNDRCMGEAHAPAHRHSRTWYRSQPELLSDYSEWVGACQYCHSIMDATKAQEEVFERLRP